MKLSQLKDIINSYSVNERNLDAEVVVVVKLPYATVGGTPCVEIKNVSMGFDWDAGKFQLFPAENLQEADVPFAEKFSDLQKKYGWSQYEKRGLESELKSLRKS
jgi:hypothetical protein